MSKGATVPYVEGLTTRALLKELKRRSDNSENPSASLLADGSRLLLANLPTSVLDFDPTREGDMAKHREPSDPSRDPNHKDFEIFKGSKVHPRPAQDPTRSGEKGSGSGGGKK